MDLLHWSPDPLAMGFTVRVTGTRAACRPAQAVHPNTVVVVLEGPSLEEQTVHVQMPLHARYPEAINTTADATGGMSGLLMSGSLT